MKKILISILITLISFSIITAEDIEKSEYYQDFVIFLEKSGTNETQRVVLKQLFSQFKTMAPNNEKLNDLEAFMAKELNNLNKKLFPVYKKYLSHSDLKEIIKFYDTPVAKKLVSSQPKIVQESMQIGMVWGQELGQRVMGGK